MTKQSKLVLVDAKLTTYISDLADLDGLQDYTAKLATSLMTIPGVKESGLGLYSSLNSKCPPAAASCNRTAFWE